jgi:DNA invertase Pin-like site-specific DNA recombinase
VTARAVIYARVSSHAQKEAHTIGSQLRVLPEFVTRMGWTLARPAKTYVDDGKSAKAGVLDKRDGFNALLADAAAGHFDVVVVIDADRLTRTDDIAERGQIYGAFQKAGVQIAVASTGHLLDLKTFMGEFYAMFQALMAAEENRKRSERTVRGKLEAARNGRNPGSRPPFGYRYEGGVWSICEPEAAIVREIYQRILARESCQEIASDFWARGLHKTMRPALQHRTRIRDIVRDSSYRGEWIYTIAGEAILIELPPIIDEATWHKSEQALAKGKFRGLNRTKPENVYLCAGIMRCEICEAPITVISASKATSYHPRGRAAFYVCSHRRSPPFGIKRCTLPRWRVAEVDGRVWAALEERIVRPGYLEELVSARAAKARSGASDWEEDRRGWERRLAHLRKHQKQVLMHQRAGRLFEDVAIAELEAIERERAMLKQQVATATKACERERELEAENERALVTIETLRAAMGNASAADRRALVRMLVPGYGDHVLRLGTEAITGDVRIPLVTPDEFRHLVNGGSSSGGREGSGAKRVRFLVVA